MTGNVGDRCIPECEREVECVVCHRRKAPRGRSVAPAMAGMMCDVDCKGFNLGPISGHLWRGELAQYLADKAGRGGNEED